MCLLLNLQISRHLQPHLPSRRTAPRTHLYGCNLSEGNTDTTHPSFWYSKASHVRHGETEHWSHEAASDATPAKTPRRRSPTVPRKACLRRGVRAMEARSGQSQGGAVAESPGGLEHSQLRRRQPGDVWCENLRKVGEEMGGGVFSRYRSGHLEVGRVRKQQTTSASFFVSFVVGTAIFPAPASIPIPRSQSR